MSFMNFLGLENPDYGNYAKGILYTIYEIFWKIVYAINSLIDVITGLFYKLAGSNYLGSGSESLVEEQDLLSKLFNQNIVSDISLIMTVTSVALMMVFGGIAIIKQNYFGKEEAKSMTGVIKNMVLATIFLICLTPLALFAISSISTLTSSLVSVFGDNSNTSLADLLFYSSFGGDPIAAYNTINGTEITSWMQMKNGFLFELAYGEIETGVTFYWFVYLLGGILVLYNLVVIAIQLIKRIFNIIILYLVAPLYVARMVDDGGNKFREWKNKALSQLISIVGTVVAFMILISLTGMISQLELIQLSDVSGDGNVVSSVKALSDAATDTGSTTVLLINNLTKVLLIVAGTSVAKDSGELLGNVFKGANDDSGELLEGIFNRLGTKETSNTERTAQLVPRTRTITRKTTATRTIVNYNESVPSSSSDGEHRPSSPMNNIRNNMNLNVNNVDRSITNIQNRADMKVNNTAVRDDGVKSGNYRPVVNSIPGEKIKPSDALNQRFVNNIKSDMNSLRAEWGFMKDNNSQSSKEIVKNFEDASKEFNSAISSGEPTRIKESMNKYVDAYRNEEKVAKKGYEEFAGKSTKLSNDLTTKQQEELKKISESYRKAQVDYGKTARKLSEAREGNMSAADALRLKENADKQREKLMEASSRASDFYNNQKKGV